MNERPYAQMGEQIKQLINALVLAKRWDKKRAVQELATRTRYADSTVYRWRQGRLRPSDETLETLAQIGHDEAQLDRSWGQSLLRSARYPETDQFVNQVWGAREIRHILNNLPRPEHTAFIGRQAELARLLQLLLPEHAAHLISVDGIGGVGKTTLVIEAAYRCLRASSGELPAPHIPTFDAIIFTSAKQQYLTPHGILDRRQAQRTLQDIFREIAVTLDRSDITRTTADEQPDRVRRALSRQQTLLIVDNLETIDDRQNVIAFLYDLPPSVKVVITTREQALFAPIRLEQLPETEGLKLIQHEAQDKAITLNEEQALALYRCTGGVPAAIVYAVGQIASGYLIEGVLARLTRHEGNVARFCFEGSVAPLRGQPAHHLLMAMAMFPKRPLREAVIRTAGLSADPIAADEGLARLQQLSLTTGQEGRYQMLPLTREYGLAELAANPDFEEEARERWIHWYLEFAEKFGG
ncbi:MAG: ATP-binding protein, partial [Chloroflexi bacterium]